MENLKKNSIRIDGSIVVCWPQQGDKEETVDMTDIGLEFDESYCSNNSTICFVHRGEVFVTPYTSKAMSTIRDAGLAYRSFYVPFSNWDYPKHEKDRWSHLCEMARNQ